MLFSSLALRVVIDISYSPPEPGYQPPYYRAASGVTLTCRAVGGTGQIRYIWSSTCSSCIPGGWYYSSSGHSRSRSFLAALDAGTHTCSAYDSGQGISGNTSIVMNIVGECLLVVDIKIMTGNTIFHTSYNCQNPAMSANVGLNLSQVHMWFTWWHSLMHSGGSRNLERGVQPLLHKARPKIFGLPCPLPVTLMHSWHT